MKVKPCACLVGLALLFALPGCAIKSVKEAETALAERFQKTFRNARHSKTATLLIHSDRLKLHLTSSAGTVAQGRPAVAGQPFHAASIGKLFTAVMVMQYAEKQMLSLGDPAHKFLGRELLKNLFVVDGVDYSDQVTIGELLSHTSGIDDYFDSQRPGSKSVLKEILNQPDKFWTPAELLDFTRKNQRAVALPGKIFHYSDTGYILLGLMLEKISGKPFEALIHEKLFDPLRMQSTYMHLRSSAKSKHRLQLSAMMLGDKDVTAFRSVSADWAGGGVISTTADLLLFHQALVTGKLLSAKTYQAMQGTHKFMDGISYGLGMMTVRFGEMAALMPKTPDLNGHSGLLSTLMFYSPQYDTHIIANLGSSDDVAATFEMMFWLMQTLKDIQALRLQGK